MTCAFADHTQEVVGSAAVSELAFNSELKYLIVRLASDSRVALEALAPDMGKLKAVAPPRDQLFGIIVTCATGVHHGAIYWISCRLFNPCF